MSDELEQEVEASPDLDKLTSVYLKIRDAKDASSGGIFKFC